MSRRAGYERRLRTRLAEVYRPLLLEERVRLRVDRAPIKPAPWTLDERHDIRVRAGGRLIRGWWGLLPDVGPAAVAQIEPGIRLYHLGRLVGPPEWFGHPGPAQHPALNRLVGEIELPHVPVTMNKSDVERGSPEWTAVEARLHALLGPVVRRLMREDAVSVDPGALRTAEQVRRILARALRLLESGRLFESDVAAGGAGSGGQLTLDSVATGSEDADGADHVQDEPLPERTESGPASPPPARTAGSGPGSRSGIGELVIRPLDPRTRSAMVVEDGVRRVIINSRYPLYEVRKGDLWYQLETALREVCQTIPEATVPEFERKVNELMLVSVGLPERRRRRTARAKPRQAPLL